LAIKGRVFKDGLRSVVFATLSKKFTLPEWLPEHFIRLDYTRFPNDLTAAIRQRVLERGGELREETAISKARQMKAEEDAESDRLGKLSYESRSAIPQMWRLLCETFEAKAAELNEYIPIEAECKGTVLVGRTSLASVVAELTPFHSEATKLHVVLFNGCRILPSETRSVYIPGLQPDSVCECLYQIDYSAARGWFWRSLESKTESPTCEGMAELLASNLIDTHRRIDTGAIQRKQFGWQQPRGSLRRRRGY